MPLADQELDLSEVYFLVLHWLSQGPCREAAAVLLREVEQQGLLPRTHAITGVGCQHMRQTTVQSLDSHWAVDEAPWCCGSGTHSQACMCSCLQGGVSQRHTSSWCSSTTGCRTHGCSSC
jgi:hypothetical protein